MKRGHVTGTKRERTSASDWYKQIEPDNNPIINIFVVS
jgi:hypothetical protein